MCGKYDKNDIRLKKGVFLLGITNAQTQEKIGFSKPI
jgi:hypothetical protein